MLAVGGCGGDVAVFVAVVVGLVVLFLRLLSSWLIISRCSVSVAAGCCCCLCSSSLLTAREKLLPSSL